jgi:lysophospholipase L1-like esterase
MISILAAAVVMNANPIQAVDVQIAGDWSVRIALGGRTTTLPVAPPVALTVATEKYDSLPVFNPNAGGWAKGVRLRGVLTQETTTPGLLDPESLVVRAGPEPESQVFEKGRDYDADLFWGTFGRLAGGRIGANQPVYASYRHGLLRLDSVVLTLGGKLVIRKGEPRVAVPALPATYSADHRLANIWLPGRVTKLTEDNLFPVLEPVYPEPPPSSLSHAERLLPKIMAKLKSGEPLRMLAWGDSVTDAGYLPDPPHERWQEQFVARLRQRYPKASIELVTEAWGGRNTVSYLAEPPGSPHNYQVKVLGAKPDLVVSEFVNDAGLNPAQVEERYSRMLADFQSIGAEWIILTPHYVRPDWMGLTRERSIDQDPRPYVAGLREFAAKHSVALADASHRWGRLWRQGIPYTSLLMNSINHPNAQGMRLFADSLIALFPKATAGPTSGAAAQIVEAALKEIYAGRIDPKLLTRSLQARMTAARIKSLSGSMHQYGLPRQPRLISVKQENGVEIATIRVMLGDTAFIVTAVLTADHQLDDLKFIEE